MADWTKPFKSAYRVMLVDSKTHLEKDRLDYVKLGGSLTRNLDSTNFESGTLSFVGNVRDYGSDWIRIWLDATWEDGSEESIPLGTFIPDVTSLNIDGSLHSGDITLKGVLATLSEDEFEEAFSVPKGANPLDAVKEVLESANLEFEMDYASFEMASAWSYSLTRTNDDDSESSTTKLSAVNNLLWKIGYAHCWTDGYGVVQCRPRKSYASAEEFTFADGAGARFLASATDERDSSEIANVVHTIYESDEDTIVGVAVDDDPESEWSTVSRGRRIVKSYIYQDSATQAAANAEAQSLLNEYHSVIRRVTLQHVYDPSVYVHAIVAVDWGSAGIDGKFFVRTQDISLGAGALAKSELKRNERNGVYEFVY